MQRREFIKTTCSLCMMAGAGLMLGSVSSCASLPIYKAEITGNKISVPVSLFLKSNLQIVRTKNAEYDIALRKDSNETFSALLLRCTHADNPLISTGNGFTCELHGSKFDNAGVALKGPAQRSLKKYSTELISDQVIITMS